MARCLGIFRTNSALIHKGVFKRGDTLLLLSLLSHTVLVVAVTVHQTLKWQHLN